MHTVLEEMLRAAGNGTEIILHLSEFHRRCKAVNAIQLTKSSAGADMKIKAVGARVL